MCERSIDPLGESKPDWEVLCLAATALGHGDQFSYSSVQEVWDEIRQVWPAGAGISYERLDHERGLQWPCLDEDDPGTQILHTDSFPRIGKRTTLAPVPYLPPGDATTELPVPARHRTRPLPVQRRHDDSAHAERHAPADRHARDLHRRCRSASASPTGRRSASAAATAPSTSSPRSPTGSVPGELFATFSDPARHVNRVTGPHQDTHTRTPEYKVTAVSIDAPPT